LFFPKVSLTQSGISNQTLRWEAVKPTLAKTSAQVFPSLKTWVARKFIDLVMRRQFSHLLRNLQGTIEKFWIAWITKIESHSSHKFCQWNWLANSIALIAPMSSAWKALHLPTFSAKQSSRSASWLLKMPPQAEACAVEDPSVLHFIQWGGWGFQRTSIMFGAFGGWMETLKLLRITKLETLAEATALEILPVKAVFDMIVESELFQWFFFTRESHLISSVPNWANDVDHGCCNH